MLEFLTSGSILDSQVEQYFLFVESFWNYTEELLVIFLMGKSEKHQSIFFFFLSGTRFDSS